MYDAIRNFVLLMWTVSAINTGADAQSSASYRIEKAQPSVPVRAISVVDLGKNEQNSRLLQQES